jgi:hypothetical protein
MVNELVHVGYDSVEGRQLYVLEVAAGHMENFQSPAERFGCFLLADATRLTDHTIRGLARALLDAGAAYFATWGPDCERVHDLIDAERPRDEPSDNDVVMTTWLADVDLDRAIWESVYVAMPAGRYAQGCNALVAIVVDNPAAAAQIRRRYGDLKRLRADVESKGESGGAG